ncbi:MAG: class I SAM-dependent methyltransferase [Pirellulales bacterium]|nr:class I SAM-dependent methyltransferase [Pirellulales bacterium]
MDKPFWAKYRREQLAHVHGEILEIGVGTGLNLPHYPTHVRKITTADPNPGMNKRLQRRIAETEINVDKRVISSEELPFDNETFDCVVSTLTLCSIPDREQAMGELFRVLRPSGRIHFLEHGISPDAKIAKWQRRLNWLQQRFSDGCSLLVDLPKLLATQPFASIEIDNFYMEQTPRTHGYMYRGTAQK